MWLKGYGLIRVFQLAAPDDGTAGAHYWACSSPDLTEAEQMPLDALIWGH